MIKRTIVRKPTLLVIGIALLALLIISLLMYMDISETSVEATSGKFVPPLTMVYEAYGPSISVGDRYIESSKELHRLEYTSETAWVDTVTEAPSVDLGRYGVGSNVGSYQRLDGNVITEYDAMDGSMEESTASDDDGVLSPNWAFAYAPAVRDFTDDTPGLSKSQVVTSAKVCYNGECEENVAGVLYRTERTERTELVMYIGDSWAFPLRMGEGFLVREVEIYDITQ